MLIIDVLLTLLIPLTDKMRLINSILNHKKTKRTGSLDWIIIRNWIHR
nr:MAG TPA: hypothetical protein [Caudoviricetes sp.]